ncbi:MAG: hypothetical protein ACKVU4_03745 [Phycisphaerales bacterium]
MLLLNPRTVKFGDSVWDDVTAVAIDREPERLVLEWSEFGPHVVLADVPQQKATLRVVQTVARDDVNAPRPGDEGTVEFFTSPASGSAGRKRVSAPAVITEVTHELSLRGGAVRRVAMIAVSPTGAADPISVTEA